MKTRNKGVVSKPFPVAPSNACTVRKCCPSKVIIGTNPNTFTLNTLLRTHLIPFFGHGMKLAYLHSKTLPMLKSYIKTAFRFILRNRVYSILNIIGLVIGISFSCMLYVYISYELSYDSFHTAADRTFRILTIDKRDAQNLHRYSVSIAPIGQQLVSSYPEVTDMVRIHRFMGQVIFEIDGQNLMERNWFMADENFFQVFDHEFISGDKTTALKEPGSIVLTESAAIKYFGTTDAVGKVLDKSNIGNVKVTGVIKDTPVNSHLQFDIILSNVRNDEDWKRYLNEWNFGDYRYIVTATYLVLKEGTDIASLKAKMPDFEAKYFSKAEGKVSVDFQNIQDIYLGSANIEEAHRITRSGQMSYIYIFSSMAIFLVIIACVNYVNLATSKAMARSREVGVRKISGANRGQLVVQYLSESFAMTLVAMIISLGVIDMALPYFNQITGKDFDVNLETIGYYLSPLFIIALIIGIISGGYPAFYLAKLKPVLSLKGKDSGGSVNTRLRQSLVVFQFVLSIIMIICTMVVGRQLKFIQSKDLGFQQDHLMVIDINSGNVRRQFDVIKNEYRKVPGVQQAATSSRVPGEWKNIHELYTHTSLNMRQSDSSKVYFMGFDEDMLDTYKLTLINGRYFTPQTISDSTAVLLNEAAVKAMGLTDPIGMNISLSADDGNIQANVIGVVKDFNFQSLHQKIAPMVIGAWNNPIQSIDYFTLRFSGDINKVIDGVTAVHNKFDEYTPIEYNFLDQQLETYYQDEKRAGMIFALGQTLSILIACLGLLGLATYNVQRRMKELGVRKVLGASGLQLYVLLSSSFVKQIGVAFVIAAPIAWYLMHEWLEAFEYKIPLTIGIFLFSGFIALFIAIITISYRALKAARTNPVQSLRQE